MCKSKEIKLLVTISYHVPEETQLVAASMVVHVKMRVEVAVSEAGEVRTVASFSAVSLGALLTFPILCVLPLFTQPLRHAKSHVDSLHRSAYILDFIM